MKLNPPLPLVQLMTAVDSIIFSPGPAIHSPCPSSVRLSAPTTITGSCLSNWCSPFIKMMIVLEVKQVSGREMQQERLWQVDPDGQEWPLSGETYTVSSAMVDHTAAHTSSTTGTADIVANEAENWRSDLLYKRVRESENHEFQLFELLYNGIVAVMRSRSHDQAHDSYSVSVVRYTVKQ